MKAKEKIKKGLVEISDSDIATIEAIHDLLLDKHKYSLEFPTLKKARELTAKMYKGLYPEYEKHSEKYFKWDQVPEGFDWVAVDENGLVLAFLDKPKPYHNTWWWLANSKSLHIKSTGKIHNDWRNLLFQRPTTEKP